MFEEVVTNAAKGEATEVGEMKQLRMEQIRGE